jgi:hypothetical protein
MQPEQLATIRRCYDAAVLREEAARSLVDPADAVAATVLLREALALFVEAIAASSGEQRPVSATATWHALVRLAPDAPFIAKARAVLASDDPLVADSLDAASLFEARSASADAVAWLRTRVDPRSPRAKRIARIVRVLAALVAAFGLAYFLGKWIRSRDDIARGREVIASSSIVGAPPPSALVNGMVEASFGVHTQTEDDPWVLIDLAEVRAIGEVRVFNRGDGWQDECLPLILEIATDRLSFSEVERRSIRFTQSDPWIAKLGGKSARWIRFRHAGHGYIALSEVEVYGGK